jgi:hypothetical protein
MEDVGIFNGYLEKFSAIWSICWLCGIFFPFWYFVEIKIWHSWSRFDG